MWDIFSYAIVTATAYLLGSFPTGYLIVRLLKGVDVRQCASGRIGGTNVYRVAGWRAAALTVLGDALKGGVAILLARTLVGTHLALVLAGVAAVWGHNHSVFLSLKGGAGTVTNIGVLAVIFPEIAVILVLLALVTALLTHYASVASLTAAVATPIALLIAFWAIHSPGEYVLYGLLAALIIIWALRPNVVRLLRGTERRVEFGPY
ncbi:MAG: glycerol-3-phosphate acyltransferase [Chloroflexi bacterium]|nr:glycerol-3-phosphate acyltransferase [Chloroflexota bacterium]